MVDATPYYSSRRTREAEELGRDGEGTSRLDTLCFPYAIIT